MDPSPRVSGRLLADPVPARAILREIEEAGEVHLGAVSSASGFVPVRPPPRSLPSRYRAWDEAAAELPRLWRDRSARRVLAELAPLPADAEHLPDEMLWRASVVLGNLAYAYVRCDVHDLHRPAPVALPEAIAHPWGQVAERMRRPSAHLAYDDVVTYNWAMRDPDRPDPFRTENLELLVPQTGNGTERSFFLVNLEMAAQAAPVLEAIVRAQEATAAGDAEGLIGALRVVLERLRHITEISFSKIDPVAETPEHADPAIWAKLVAPSGIPIVEGVPGISGAGAPALQLVDSFLGRTRYESHLGKSGQLTRQWYAPNVRRFMDAVEQVQVRPFVERSNNRRLKGLFQSVLDAYAGNRGYLGVHRRKVYGFIQTAFKVGRPATASGISSDQDARAWRETHDQLDEAAEERYAELFSHSVTARLAGREPVSSASGDRVQRVSLDASETGLIYRPGDRVAVAPTNSGEAVGRTLETLRATGSEALPLPALWRAELRRRTGVTEVDRVSLRTFLTHAALRPLSREIGKQLLALAEPPLLEAVLERRGEDQWELADAFEAMATAGYDMARLWRSQLWEREALARIVPPTAARLYSISGAPDGDSFPKAIPMTVGRVKYESPGAHGAALPRAGTASTLLTERLGGDQALPIDLVRPQRFALPEDPSRELVMFAAGTGIAPFIGFLEDRAGRPDAGPSLLLCAVRTRSELAYPEWLANWEAAGVVRVELAVSRESVGAVPPRRIDALIDELADDLWSLMRGSACFYVCGQGGFASTVLSALEAVGRERVGESEARVVLRRMVAHRRLMLDVFTTFAPLAQLRPGERTIEASELALRNDDEHGWWMAISGVVYDLTEFRHLHLGGRRIIDDHCGIDASREYREIRHHLDPEIEAMLAMYRIGLVRRLDLAGVWGIAIVQGQVRSVTLTELYRMWVAQLYRVTGLQNTLRNDVSSLSSALTSAEDPHELTPLKVGLFFDTQSRFLTQYLAGMAGASLEELWAVSAGLADPRADANELRRELRALRGPDGVASWPEVSSGLDALIESGGMELEGAGRVISGMIQADEALLAAVKAALGRGVAVFEARERDALAHGTELLDALRRIPPALADYRQRLQRALESASR